MKAPHWSARLQLQLSKSVELRVLDKGAIVRMARSHRSTLSNPTIDRWIADSIAAGRLLRVERGVYLNCLVHPPVQLCEASGWLRRGALVSLQTVLRECGLPDDGSDVVTAVVPLSPRLPSPTLGTVETEAGKFNFRGIPERILEAGEATDRLAPALSYLRATPEAALLHWLYLARSPHSSLSPPPVGINAQLLDPSRLQRLAAAMDLREEAQAWYRERAAPKNDGRGDRI